VSTPPSDLATTLGKILDDLAEIKSLAHTVATHGEDIELGKKAIAKIEERLAEIDVLVAGLPAWLARMVRLEQKQESDDQDRRDEDAETREGAGTAGDPEHRAMARDEAAPLVKAAEDRTDVNIGKLWDRLGEVISAVREVQGTTLVVLTVGALLGAVFLFIAVRALGF
jgi:hypothetical protein